MNRSWMIALLVALTAAILSLRANAFPQPSPYPISWQLKFDHDVPKRIVVTPPGSNVPQAYWYMTFTVTNTTDSDLQFLPEFDMSTSAGDILRSDFEDSDGCVRCHQGSRR